MAQCQTCHEAVHQEQYPLRSWTPNKRSGSRCGRSTQGESALLDAANCPKQVVTKTSPTRFTNSKQHNAGALITPSPQKGDHSEALRQRRHEPPHLRLEGRVDGAQVAQREAGQAAQDHSAVKAHRMGGEPHRLAQPALWLHVQCVAARMGSRCTMVDTGMEVPTKSEPHAAQKSSLASDWH